MEEVVGRKAVENGGGGDTSKKGAKRRKVSKRRVKDGHVEDD